MLRLAKLTDDEAIAKLWRLAWASANPHASYLEPLDHWLARVRTEFLLPNHTVVYEKETLGILAFMVLDVADKYLHQLFVHPDVHRSGIGSEFLRQVCILCPEGWSLHVATANTGAQHFYERHGLVKGAASLNPSTYRERLTYSWQPHYMASEAMQINP